MKRLINKFAAVWLAGAVLAVTCGVRLCRWELPEHLELITYDLRARSALHFPTPAATNLAFVSIDESSILTVANSQELGFHAQYPWPRQIHGRLIQELAAEGAKGVAFDILFGELHPDRDAPVLLPDGSTVESDDYFARAMRQGGNTFIAATPDVVPPDLFLTNCLSLGDVSTEKDPDGILRRACAFHIVRHWHPLFQQLAMEPDIGADLANAQLAPGKILIPRSNSTNLLEVPVDADNRFRLADFGVTPTPGAPTTAQAFAEERVWHLGIVLAARALNLDLAHARVDLPAGRITLPVQSGGERVLPVDSGGYFYVDWRLPLNDPQLGVMPVEYLLLQNRQREAGQAGAITNWADGRLVVVGSSAVGNNLTDRGATPLERSALLVSTYWNVANAVIMGHYIWRLPVAGELMVIILLGALTALLTWRLRTLAASLSVLLLLAGYLGLAWLVYIHWRVWLPIVFPLGGAVLMQHFVLVTHRVLFEEREKRRVKSVFSKMVSPAVVNELLQAERLSVEGARREMTVLFADIRGFTSLTDQMQERVAEFVRENQLEGARAEECFDESAKETLRTVNLYLATVAEAVKRHDGTLDKYIGDCVMAFWNAPVANDRHAADCVLAAVDAQRAISELNRKRLAENPAREAQNVERVAAGRPPLPLHTPLQLGTGINTGQVIVGLMGSDEHGFNFTVFGREVNLASRLEGVSGSGRIIISEVTFGHLSRTNPTLAATCAALPPEKVKGIREAVKIYEVPWRQPDEPSAAGAA